MNKKKFDSTTAKKIINEYADKINFYMKENTSLKSQIEDMKITLNINKELIIKYISRSIDNNDQQGIIIDLKNENSRLTEANDRLYTEKNLLDRKVSK